MIRVYAELHMKRMRGEGSNGGEDNQHERQHLAVTFQMSMVDWIHRDHAE